MKLDYSKIKQRAVSIKKLSVFVKSRIQTDNIAFIDALDFWIHALKTPYSSEREQQVEQYHQPYAKSYDLA